MLELRPGCSPAGGDPLEAFLALVLEGFVDTDADRVLRSAGRGPPQNARPRSQVATALQRQVGDAPRCADLVSNETIVVLR